MSVTQVQLTASGADFTRVFSRMTALECYNLLVGAGYVTTDAAEPPTYLTAEGCLGWLQWQNGAGDFDPSQLSGKGQFTASGTGINRLAYLLYNRLVTSWGLNPILFLTLTGASTARQLELIQPQLPLDLTPQITRIMVGSSNANMATAIAAYPYLTERDNIIIPIDHYYNKTVNGTPVGQAVLDVNSVATYLISQPAGRRYLYAGRHTLYVSGSDVGCMLGIPVTSGPGNGRYAFWDLEMTTANRIGIDMTNYRTQIAASDSKLRTFVVALLAAGAAEYGSANATDILDGFVFDIENLPIFYNMQLGVVGSSSGSFQMVSPITSKTVSAVDTSGNEITTSATHGWTTGDAVILTASVGGSVPGGLTAGVPYYVNVSGGTTKAKFYTRRATALSPGTEVDLTNSGSGTITARWVTETADEIFADSYWTNLRDNVFQPTVDQTVWDKTNLKVSGAYTWYADNFPFLVDAYITKTYLDSLNIAAGVFLDSFPNLRINCYDAALISSLYSFDLPQDPWAHPFGIGASVGGGVSIPLYGAPQVSESRWNWQLSIGGSDGTIEAITGTTNQKYWGYFLMDYSRHMAMCRASTKERTPWIAYDTMPGYALWGTGGLWQEVVLHSALTSHEINYYNATASSAQHKQLVDLIRERDDVALYVPGQVVGDYVSAIDYTNAPKYVHTACWCGYRWVARYTPNPTLSPTWAQVGDNVVITYGDATTTTIADATLVTYTGSTATLGFWVTMAAAAMPVDSTTFPNTYRRVLPDTSTYRRTA